MILRNVVPGSFDYDSMPVKSDRIGPWLKKQKPHFSFPFFRRELLADESDKQRGCKILHGLLNYRNPREGHPFGLIVGGALLGLHHILAEDASIATAEVGLLLFTDGEIYDYEPEGVSYAGLDHAEEVGCILKSGMSPERKILDIRNYVAQKCLGGKGDDRIVSMHYLKWLETKIFPFFFGRNSEKRGFEEYIYPRITRMFAMLEMTGLFQFNNSAYTLSPADGEDWIKCWESHPSPPEITQGEKSGEAPKWKIRISLPKDHMLNADLYGFFGIFTEEHFHSHEEREARGYANLREGPSRYPAAPALLLEICCGLFAMSLDAPRYRGMNCMTTADGRPYRHAPGYCPDAYALYRNGCALTLEPSLKKGKTHGDWVRSLRSAAKHLKGNLLRKAVGELYAREDALKGSLVLGRELPTSVDITQEVIKTAAETPDIVLIPMSFAMIQALITKMGETQLRTISPDRIRDFMAEIKTCMTRLHHLMQAEKAKDGKADVKHINAGKDAGTLSPAEEAAIKDTRALLPFAKEGNLQKLMAAIIEPHLPILTQGLEQKQADGDEKTSKKGTGKGPGR